MTRPVKLTPAQRRALDAIVAAGYASVSWNYAAYHAGEVRIQYRVVDALRRLGLVKGRAVPARGTFPDGRVNAQAVSRSIVEPVERTPP